MTDTINIGMLRKIILVAVLFSMVLHVNAQEKIPAFPGADGYGKYATGGRGGRVIFVTHIKDSQDKFSAGYKGSLRAALETSGSDPITIVFQCGGVISLQGAISCSRSNITLAGQTALGDGICVKGYGIKFSGNNIIVRHMRFRVGDDIQQNDPALTFSNGKTAIFDHCSFSWSVEENVNITDVDSVTIQWCINSESLYHSFHDKGDRGYAAQWGGEHASYHHNLLAHHMSRMPRQNGNTSDDYQLTWDYRNNVHYNWGNPEAFYGGGVEQNGGFCHSNLINNYYRPGPATTTNKSSQYFCAPSGGRPAVTGEGHEYDFGYGLWYLEGNVMYDNPDKTNDNWSGLYGPAEHYADGEFEVAPVTLTGAEVAYMQVLNNAGATKPVRDEIDARIINEVLNGNASFGGITGSTSGIIDRDDDLKPAGADASWTAWDIYEKVLDSQAPADTDEDGIPDDWEDSAGLDKNNPDDGKLILESGYSNLEVYLNELAGEINTGIPLVKSPGAGFTIYPNPSSAMIGIHAPVEMNELNIFNISGQKIVNRICKATHLDMDISNFEKGLYLVQVFYNDGTTSINAFVKN